MLGLFGGACLSTATMFFRVVIREGPEPGEGEGDAQGQKDLD